MLLAHQPAPPPGPTRNHTGGIRPVVTAAAVAAAYVSGRWGLAVTAGAAALLFWPLLAAAVMVMAHRSGEAPWQPRGGC